MARTQATLALLTAAACAAALSACQGHDLDPPTSVKPVAAPACDDVEYAGAGSPTKLIVSDLPMHGDSAEQSRQMVAAIEQEIARKAWLAGQVSVAFQACDDSLPSTGMWDPARCRQNARAYAANPDVIGVIGTSNSGCAAEEIPILNRAPGGGMPMVSPGNTFVCLTQPSPTLCKPDEPGRYYPSGTRNYVRVVPNDAFQGAGLALFANGLGVKRPYILYAANDPVAKGQGQTFQGAARSLGMRIAGFEQWNPNSSGYSDLMKRARDTGADAVLLAGQFEDDGARLIQDKVGVLGPNTGRVKLLAMDGFAQQATIDKAGRASKGMFVSLPGKAPASLIGEGDVFVKEIRAQVKPEPVEVYAPYAGQAVELLMKAIAQGPTRAETIHHLFDTPIAPGIVGTFAITPTGDPDPGPISISTASDTFQLAKTLIPPPNLVRAARGG